MKTRLLGLLMVLATVPQAFAYTQNKLYKFTILHTNDHHGRFWQNSDGEYGLAARATLIRELREEIKNAGGQSFLIDAGDVNTGIPQSDMLDAEPDFKGMAQLGYDVMVIGNHEFDNPVTTIKKQQEWAGFPFISANIYEKTTQERVFPPYVVLKSDDLNIAILGLTTKDTPLKSDPNNSKGLEFKDPIEVAKKEVPTLRAFNDVVIALTHMGHYPNEQHGSDAPGDVTLARQVNGLDAIVGGHTQLPLFEADVQNGTYIVQAYEWGKYVGRLDFEFLNGKLTLKNYKLIPVNLIKKETVNGAQVVTYLDKEITPDAEMLALLTPFQQQGEAVLRVKIAATEEKLIGDRSIIRKQETNLGNLVTHAYKTVLKADLSVSNSGGIRADIAEGDISYETVLTVLPFGNQIATVDMNADQLIEFLTKVSLDLAPGTGSFPQLSGVKMVVDRATRKIESLDIGGVPVKACKKTKNKKKPRNSCKIYRLAIPEFIATGGDGYPNVSTLPTYKKYGFTDADLFRRFLEEEKVIKAGKFAPTNYLTVK